jgi:hypothetical protein
MEAERYTRRLSDKILWAFDQAIEIGDVDIACLLMRALELALTKEGGLANAEQRRDFEQISHAYTRLAASRKFAMEN